MLNYVNSKRKLKNIMNNDKNKNTNAALKNIVS